MTMETRTCQAVESFFFPPFPFSCSGGSGVIGLGIGACILCHGGQGPRWLDGSDDLIKIKSGARPPVDII